MARRRPASWIGETALNALPERCQAPFSSDEKESQARAKERVFPCALKGVGSGVGWGWPHLQSRCGWDPVSERPGVSGRIVGRASSLPVGLAAVGLAGVSCSARVLAGDGGDRSGTEVRAGRPHPRVPGMARPSAEKRRREITGEGNRTGKRLGGGSPLEA